jgi:cysteinyl-tRNA synthetase
MVTIHGQKMGKSLNNFITLEEFFKGNHTSLQQAYSPMTIRFFILQAHYRSTLDFSNEALQAAEKGLKKLMAGIETLEKLKPSALSSTGKISGASGDSGISGYSATSSSDIKGLLQSCYDAMNDDFNSPVLIANLFEGVRIINSVNDKKETITSEDLSLLKELFRTFISEVLGLKNETPANQNEILDGLMKLILSIRQKSRETKDWGTSDQIRDVLQKLNITVKDGKNGSSWSTG